MCGEKKKNKFPEIECSALCVGMCFWQEFCGLEFSYFAVFFNILILVLSLPGNLNTSHDWLCQMLSKLTDSGLKEGTDETAGEPSVLDG